MNDAVSVKNEKVISIKNNSSEKSVQVEISPPSSSSSTSTAISVQQQQSTSTTSKKQTTNNNQQVAALQKQLRSDKVQHTIFVAGLQEEIRTLRQQVDRVQAAGDASVAESEKKIKARETEIETLRRKQQQSQLKIREFEKQNETLRAELKTTKESKASAIDVPEKRVDFLRRELATAKNTTCNRKGQQSFLEKQLEQQLKSVENEKKSLEESKKLELKEVRSQIQAMSQNVSDMTDDLQKQLNQLNTLTDQLNQLSPKHQIVSQLDRLVLHQRLDQEQQTTTDLKEQRSSVENQLVSASLTINSLEEEVRTLKSKLHNSENQSLSLQQKLDTCTEELKKEKSNLSNAKEESRRLKAKHEADKRSISVLHTSRKQLEADKKQLEADKKQLEQQLASVKSENKSFEESKKLELKKIATAHSQQINTLTRQLNQLSPKHQIVSQLDDLVRYAKIKACELNDEMASFNFLTNPCLKDMNNSLLEMLSSNTDANFSKILRTDLFGDNDDVLSPQFELAFHGTKTDSAWNIMCKGFDPAKRSRSLYGPGEYFGDFTKSGYKTAKGYDSGAFIIALIVKSGKVTRVSPAADERMLVVNNPRKSTTFCVPLCVAFNTTFPPTRPCTCQKPTKTDTSLNSAAAGATSSASSSSPTGGLSASPSAAASSSSSPSASSASSSSSSSSSLQVQYLDDNNKWQTMDSQTSATIIQQSTQGTMQFSLRINSYDYAIDLSNNTQTNSTTGKIRKIRIV